MVEKTWLRRPDRRLGKEDQEKERAEESNQKRLGRGNWTNGKKTGLPQMSKRDWVSKTGKKSLEIGQGQIGRGAWT